MQILKTPRPDLPESVANHLVAIKSVFMDMNPDIPEAPLVTMLNCALQPRFRGTSYKELARELHEGSIGQLERIKRAKLSHKRHALHTSRIARRGSRKDVLNALSLKVLLEDGMHPMATLTGFHVNYEQVEDLHALQSTDIENFVDFACSAAAQFKSPLFNPAIVCIDDPWHSVFWSQKSIVDQLVRFAPMLSNKRDPLSACWEYSFRPKLSRFERETPRATALSLAIGAITEACPSLASDRIARADWTHLQRHLWAVGGYSVELGEQKDLSSFIQETFKYPAQIEARAIVAINRIEGHPLRRDFSRVFLNHHLQDAELTKEDDLYLAAAHSPELAEMAKLSYSAIAEKLFNGIFAQLDLCTIDFALSGMSDSWGQPVPSQDAGLLNTKISRHIQWIDNVADDLGMTISSYHSTKGVFPKPVLDGTIPEGYVPECLVDDFVHQLAQKALSPRSVEFIKGLRIKGKLPSDFLVYALTTTGKSVKKSRLARAYHQGLVTPDEVAKVRPGRLDSLISSDLGL